MAKVTLNGASTDQRKERTPIHVRRLNSIDGSFPASGDTTVINA